MSHRFWKYHGLGNDFLIVEGDEKAVSQEEVRALCNRHRGVGADGVICVSDDGDDRATMVIFNRDGSRPEMCGNGVRCVAAHAYWRWNAQREIAIRSDAGWRQCRIEEVSTDLAMVAVDMGAAKVEDLAVADPADHGGEGLHGLTVDMGNPHYVLWQPPGQNFGDEQRRRLVALGERFNGGHEAFPEGVNVEWAIPHAEGFEVWVYERGVGLTEACGTGACAVAAAAWESGRWRPSQEVVIDLPGGRLAIANNREIVVMKGPAAPICEGRWPLRWEKRDHEDQ